MRKARLLSLFAVGSLVVTIICMVGVPGGKADEQMDGPVSVTASPYKIVSSFNSANCGAGPNGSLTFSGTTLYGMTGEGGDYGSGTIFKLDTQTNTQTVLYSFRGYPTDGNDPKGDLIASGTTLYGMANAGGAYDQGVIFKFDANQNAETVLYSFGGVPGDGTNPFGSLTLSGKILYGMTGMGGANNRGTIFMFDMNKQVETVLHSFADDLIDGYYPSGSLTLLGTSLYGVTYYGGSNNHGTIFKFDTQKKAETVLYNFAGPPGDGSGSDGSLTLLGKTLYGMTPGGGAHDMGTIFKFDTQKKVET